MTMVIAHRGGRGKARDNSIEAFEEAIRAGADMIEFDVRRTVDGELIVFHGEKCGRTPISAATFSEVRSAIGYSPATLSEVVEAVGGRVAMDVEIKEAGYELQVLSQVAQFKAACLVITSFSSEVLRAVANLDPGGKRGYIVGARSRASGVVDGTLAAGATHLVMHRSQVGQELLGRARDAGLSVLVWTVNRKVELVSMLAEPLIAGVITDQTQLALRLRDPI